MKKHAFFALAGLVAVAFATSCADNTPPPETEVHNVTIQDNYIPVHHPHKASNPEAFEPVNRF